MHLAGINHFLVDGPSLFPGLAGLGGVFEVSLSNGTGPIDCGLRTFRRAGHGRRGRSFRPLVHFQCINGLRLKPVAIPTEQRRFAVYAVYLDQARRPFGSVGHKRYSWRESMRQYMAT